MSTEVEHQHRVFRRTKIVATLGPATATREKLEELLDAGANLFRLNMSHGTHAEHRERAEIARAAAASRNLPIALLADLCGPKIRVGRFVEGQIELVTGAMVTVTTEEVVGEPGLIPTSYAALVTDVRAGNRILLDDGNLELVVVSVAERMVLCRVIQGGVLKDKKGMNLPDVAVSAPSLTEQDRNDAAFALSLGVEFLALSFVRSASDVLELREFLRSQGKQALLVAKIEKPEAVENIEEILLASDAIMVARGDLGVELSPERVPIIQEELVDLARSRQRPVIVATQMLESMITHARPTRAEVTDVANAVRSGADAVMLSAETAAGRHPTAAVATMVRVIVATEAHMERHGAFGNIDAYTPTQLPSALGPSLTQAFAGSATRLGRELSVAAVVLCASSANEVATMSAARPSAPILACVDSPDSRGLGCLAWGVVPLTVSLGNGPNHLAEELVRQRGVRLARGRVLVISGLGTEAPKLEVREHLANWGGESTARPG